MYINGGVWQENQQEEDSLVYMTRLPRSQFSTQELYILFSILDMAKGPKH